MEGLEFSGFWFDPRALLLYRLDGRDEPVEVKPAPPLRALQVLKVLLEQPGETLTRNDIIRKAWGRNVTPENVDVHIVGLRDVLEEKHDRASKDFKIIESVRKRGPDSPGGYRLAVAVCVVDRVFSQRADPGRETQRTRPRLSIIVLPFADYSEDGTHQYFADGITDDLTTDLSRIDGTFVISRNTAFTLRGRPVDTKQIGRELGVRYVLEGSVRRWERQIRVNAQLIDADSDAHLWADRFDRDMGDLLALQNDITSQIAIALNAELINAEATRPAEHPDALGYIFRGRAVAWGKLPSPENCAEAIELFEHALTLDPRSVGAELAGQCAS